MGRSTRRKSRAVRPERSRVAAKSKGTKHQSPASDRGAFFRAIIPTQAGIHFRCATPRPLSSRDDRDPAARVVFTPVHLTCTLPITFLVGSWLNPFNHDDELLRRVRRPPCDQTGVSDALHRVDFGLLEHRRHCSGGFIVGSGGCIAGCRNRARAGRSPKKRPRNRFRGQVWSCDRGWISPVVGTVIAARYPMREVVPGSDDARDC